MAEEKLNKPCDADNIWDECKLFTPASDADNILDFQ